MTSAAAPARTDALEVRGLTKRFLGQVALDDVSLSVRPGEARALIGHNGSGKSTLIKILAGIHQPDAGTAKVGGASLRFGDPEGSLRSGLRFVHQDLGLVDGLDVLENLKFGGGAYRTAFPWRIRWRQERRWARELLERYDLKLDPATPVSALSPVERTKLAIARAVQDSAAATVLVLDEPTASLPTEQVDELFSIVRGVMAQGVAVLYVSHRLEELYEICQTVTVLRDGRMVGEAPTEALGKDRLAEMIIGKPPAAEAPAAARSGGAGDRPPVLVLDSLRGGHLTGLDLSVRPEEVVGVAGLAGSGIHDLVELLLGQIPREGGTVTVDGVRLEDSSPGRGMRVGLAALPASRRLKTIQQMTVRENLTLPDLAPMWKAGVFRNRIDREVADRLIGEFDVRPPESERMLATLSGGNQQKVCVARWLRTAPKVFVLDEPTAGIDVGGRAQILQFLREGAANGSAIVVCSSDLDDLTEICSRVAIVRDGRNATELTGKEITRERIATESYRSGG